MKRQTVPDRIDSLQCLRGLAALGVFLSHISDVEKLHFARHLPSGFGVGAFGVDLFFVLSGFVIVHSMSRRPGGVRESIGFVIARLGRIFPVYWAVLIPCALVAAVAPSWITDTRYPSMLQTVLLLPASAPPLVHPAWSLVHELYFYGLLAIMALFPRRWLAPALLLWGGSMVATQVAHAGKIADPVLHLVANPLNLEFMLGAFVRLSLPYLRPAWPRIQAAACGLAFLAGAAVLTRIMAAEADAEAWRVLLVGLPAAGLISGAVAIQPSGWPRLWSALKGLGDRSYGFYLVHFPICMAVSSWLVAHGRLGWGDIALYVALAVVLTATATELIHRLVERPSIRWAHGLARRIGRGPQRREPASLAGALPLG
jgi:peptidoglycan/LPS O-acetylase OafA/YrhL